MTSQLRFRQDVDLPRHPEGDFDHGDVFLSTEEVFLANTVAGAVEVVDGAHLRHTATVPDCPEASGVLVAQEDALVFAAAQGAGKLLVIDPTTKTVQHSVGVGPHPNGLAYVPAHHYLLVADVQDNIVRLIAPRVGQVRAETLLPGRPHWSVYDQYTDQFLVNIREPALVAVLKATSGALVGQFPASAVGLRGLDLDQEGRQAYIACNDGCVVTLDLSTGGAIATVSIAGAPDAIWHNHRAARLYVDIENPGVLEVINTSTMTVEQHIATEGGAHTTAFDPVRQRLSISPSCRVSVYEEGEVSS